MDLSFEDNQVSWSPTVNPVKSIANFFFNSGSVIDDTPQYSNAEILLKLDKVDPGNIKMLNSFKYKYYENRNMKERKAVTLLNEESIRFISSHIT